MRSDLPPLIWLRAFETVARHLSFTDAGKELNLTQAAVSKHVKALELHLGHELFARSTRSLRLTKLGEAYVPKVKDAFERLAVGTHEVFGGTSAQQLTLRCAISFAVNWLAPRLPDFLSKNPGKDIRIISSVWNDAFDADVYDLDIQYGKGDREGVRSHRLSWETVTPLCAPSVAETLKSPDDLIAHRLLHVLGYQEGWGTWLKAAGAKGVNPGQGCQFDTSLMAFEVAAEGAGVALGRTSLAHHDRVSGRLVTPFDLEVPIEEAFHLWLPAGRNMHPDAETFRNWIVDYAAQERVKA